MKGKIFFILTLCLSLTSGVVNGWAMARMPRESSQTDMVEKKPAIALPMELTLLSCYELALKRSEVVAIQKEKIEEAEAQFYKASGDALGEVNFVMTREMQDIQKAESEGSSVGGTLSDPDRRHRRFVISQSLFKGFKAIGAIMSAGSLKGAQRKEWIRAKQLLFLDVASAFYAVLQQQKDLENIEGIHQLLMERIEELEEREKIGRSRPSEVATARSRTRILEAELAKSKGALGVARYVMEFLTGAFMENSVLLDQETPPFENQSLEGYLENMDARPDVDAARKAVKTALGGVVVAQSGFWPEISVEHTQYERREGFQSNLDWDFLFTIDVPLFKGGETWGEFKESRSQWKQAKLSYSLAKRQAELEIKEAYQNWIAAYDQAKALAEAVKAAEENFQLQKQEYERNLVGNLDVLEALRSLFETKRQANEVNYQTKQNFWSLRVASGLCCEEGLSV